MRLVLPYCDSSSATNCSAFTAGQSCSNNNGAVTPCFAGATNCNGGCAVCDCPPADTNDPNSPAKADCNNDELVWGNCNASLCTLGQVHSCSSCEDDCVKNLNLASIGDTTTTKAICVEVHSSISGVDKTSSPLYQCQAANGAICQKGYVDADEDIGLYGNNGCECNVAEGLCSALGNSACDLAINQAVLAGNTDSEPLGCINYYIDSDNDGYGNLALAPKCLCSPTAIYTASTGGDCNDDNKQINPGVIEQCDDIDNNCNNQNNEGENTINCNIYYADSDGDSFGFGEPKCICNPTGVLTATNGDDCDDNPTACGAACYPGANKKSDGYDHDCDKRPDYLVSHFVGPTGGPGFKDGIGSAATFYRPTGITNDGTNLFVTDSQNHTIRKIVIATGEVSTIAGSAGIWGSTDGAGINSAFNYPYGIVYIKNKLYIVDSSNNAIRLLDL
ncbi:MAG: hypothetical protein JW841_14075 [Deltaproteobacteria bacterium]|nr:hypothetical protein [Deltaproteobacteria bacterium]